MKNEILGNEGLKYFAFISYTHDNKKIARWLKKQFLSYRLTATTVKHKNLESKKTIPVFLDEDDMRPGELHEETKKQLAVSKFLIVICSKNVVDSFWVNEEIKYFIECGKSPENIILLIVEESQRPEEELFPSFIKELRKNGHNLVAASFFDKKNKAKHQAFLKILATIHGIDTHEIENQDRIITKRKRITALLLSIVFLITIIGFSILIKKTYYSPSIELSFNSSVNENNVVKVGNMYSMNLDVDNIDFENTPIFLEIDLPKCAVPTDYCKITDTDGSLKEIEENIFDYKADISKYISQKNSSISFNLKFVDFNLKLDENILPISVYLEYDGIKLVDSLKISITPDNSEIKNTTIHGWGDNSETGRSTVTQSEYEAGQLDDIITFNRISDGVIGNELNFVGAREYNGEFDNRGKLNVAEGTKITAVDGQDYIVRLYLHNLCCSEDNIAHNVKTTFIIPQDSNDQQTIYGLIESSNANPSKYWDSVVFIANSPFHFEYYENSALLENNGIGSKGGITLSDDIVTSGTLVGYDKLDGDIPGGYECAAYISIKVRVVYD